MSKKGKETEKPNYYAIIPASIRYDKRLKAAEKLLYGEITCLTNQKGFCWATNEYLSGLYDTSVVTVSRWINNLSKFGYIRTEITKTKTGSARKIYISDPLIKNDNTPLPTYQKSTDPLIKNDNTPLIKNDKHNNTSIINNTRENKREEENAISQNDKINNEVVTDKPLKDLKRNDDNTTPTPKMTAPPPPDFSKEIEVFVTHYSQDGENMSIILPQIKNLISNQKFNTNEWPKIAAHIPEYFKRTVKHNTKGKGEWRRKAYNYIINQEWLTNPNPEKNAPKVCPPRMKINRGACPKPNRFAQYQNV